MRFRDTNRRPFSLALGAGLGFGVSFSLIAQIPDGAGALPLVIARALSLSILGVAAIVVRPKAPSVKTCSVSALAGTLDMAANGLFLWSTREGQLTIVGALVNLFPAATVLLAVVFLGERLSRTQLLGLGLVLGAAGLMS